MIANQLTTALARAPSKLSRCVLPSLAGAALVRAGPPTASLVHQARTRTQMRGFSTTSIRAGSIMPDGSAPDIKTNPKDAAMSSASCSVLELSDHQYHTLADQWIDDALTKLEELQDSRADIEVEYAAGVLSLSYGTVGTYVINKQPPNKQIWLSSPVSGPSRYDYVVFGDSQNEKEGTGRGAWMNMRDKRLLDDLLGEELGINFKVAIFSQ